MRPLVEKALDLVRSAREGPPYLVISAPTGYGKTVSAPLIASELIGRGFCYSFVHSLPFRAIVRDVYRCTILNSLIDCPGLRDECKKSEEVLDLVGRVLRGVGIDVDDVAYQMGEHLGDKELKAYQRKEPLFDARYVVTTLDSLVLNMFRIPVTELYNYRKHYTIPWSRIYVSAILLDEAHAIVEDYDESSRSRAFTVFKMLLEVAGAAKIPVVVSSATLPERLVEAVVGSLGEGVTVVKLGKSAEEGGRRVVVKDEDFESSVLSVKWETSTISSSDVVGKVKERVLSGRRVFVACDSIDRAVSLYRELSKELGGESVVLLHSMLRAGDKEERLRRLGSGSTKVLVATSVVEAGVDVSFDDLVTDGGNPFSVIQRVGRVCRRLNCKEAGVYVVREFSEPQLVEFVEKHRDKVVLWRLPYDVGDSVGYRRLLEAVPLEEDYEVKSLLEELLHPLLIPQDDLKRVLEKMGGSLLRELLVTVVVGEEGSLSGMSYEEFLRSTVIADLERLRKLASRGCVAGLYALLRDREDPTRVAEAKPVDLELRRALGRDPRRATYEYIERVRRVYREYRDRVIATVFLAREECYGDTGLGYV